MCLLKVFIAYKFIYQELFLKKCSRTPVRKEKKLIKRKCKIIYTIQLLQSTTTNHIKYIKIVNLHL